MNPKKSILTILLLACSFSTSIQAWSLFDEWNKPEFNATVRAAYFIPSSSIVKDIYSDGWADYQLELGATFCNNLQLWTGVSGFSKNGRSIISDSFSDRGCLNPKGDSTTLQLIPIYLGFKYFIPLTCNLNAYVGAAACYSLLRIKDHSHYVKEHVRKNEFGGLVQSGLNYYFSNCLFLNVFADYYFQEFHFSNHSTSYCNYIERSNLNMGGFKIGGGIGFSF